MVNREGVVEIYDTGRRQRIGVIEPSEDDFTTSIAVDREGMHLATGSKHGIASVYSLPDLVSGTTAEDAIRMRRDITSGVWGIAVDGDHLATSSHGSLNVWDIASASLLAQPALEIDTPPFAAFSPDGRSLIYADGEYELKRLFLDPEELIQQARQRVTRELTEEECNSHLGPGNSGQGET